MKKKIEIHILSKKHGDPVNWKELWYYRELFYILVWRNVKIRYKQTVLGVFWVILQPLVSTIIFTIFFGKLAKIPSYDLPYSLFVLSGLVYWTFFSTAVSQASSSLIAHEGIMKKVYFPKIILPVSAIFTGYVDFFINFLFLLLLSVVLGHGPSLSGIIIFPLSLFLTSITAMGLGFFLAALNVRYRDVNYILPYFIQLLLFLTPVIYPTAILSQSNKMLIALNPITTVVESTRFVFSSKISLNPEMILISFISAICIFIFGLWYFQRSEHVITDIV